MQGSDPGERFRRRALRRGYKVDEVDEFLERVDATLVGNPDGPPVTAEEVHNVVFRVRFGGYDEWEVDKHLDRLERQLTEMENQPAAHPAAHPAALPSREMRREPAAARAGALVGGAAAAVATPVGSRAAVPSPSRVGNTRGTSRGGVGMASPTDEASTQFMPAVRPSPYGDPSDGGPPTDEFDTPSEFRDDFPEDDYQEPAQPQGPYQRDYPDQQQGYAAQAGYDQGYQEPYAEQQGYQEPYGQPAYREEPTGAGSYRGAAGYAGGQQQPAEEESWSAQLDRDGRQWETQGWETQGGGSRDPGSWDTGATVMWSNQGAGGAADIPLPGVGSRDGRHGKSEMTAEMPQYGNSSPYTPQDATKVDQLRSTFKQRRFGSGYDVDQVDRLFDGISAVVTGRSGGRIDPEDLVPHFELVQGGYYEDEVDAALGEVRNMLGRRG
ncbi:DivIVA domain-containing protein [Fodinicola acaciae]|uniref:DivIVA domain-containing protein n=1 Tax=Fodinicola acaciae TaxID=2681555 RepID=UPI0013D7637C|nr:DivIVA domain-containing protein [Fodinicola acaciae]